MRPASLPALFNPWVLNRQQMKPDDEFLADNLTNYQVSKMAKLKLEYIWRDGYEPVANLRGKTKILEGDPDSLTLEDCGSMMIACLACSIKVSLRPACDSRPPYTTARRIPM